MEIEKFNEAKEKSKPLLFSTEMVRAILDGGKTQTRRLKKSEKPPFEVGDTIWVKETFAEKGERLFYRADETELENAGLKGLYDFTWKGGILMPKRLARIFLEVVSVRSERLNDISEKDAIAEGVMLETVFSFFLGKDLRLTKNYLTNKMLYMPARISYKTFWSKINGVDSWDKSPEVWVIKFKVKKFNN